MRKLIFLGLILCSLGFFLPEIASRTFAKKQLVDHLETQLGGKVTIEKVALSWWKGQSCQRVEWIDPKHGFICRADEIELKAGLWECLQYKNAPLDVVIKKASVQSDAELVFLKNKKKRGLFAELPLIQARLEKGTITFGHTPVKLNEKHEMHTKGKIDLGENRLDLTLGIPAKMLRKVVGIKEIPDVFVLEVPISTSLNSKAFEQELLLSLLTKKGFDPFIPKL